MDNITTPKLWGMAPSTLHRNITYLFQAVLAHPHFTTDSFWPLFKISCQRFSKNARQAPFGFPNIQPWNIPSDDQIEYLETICRSGWNHKRTEQQAQCYPAVSLFLRFFNALPRTLQPHIRNVRLFEANTSAALPECHALGLLPIIATHQSLRIERYVNIRHAALPNPHMWRIHRRRLKEGYPTREISACYDHSLLRLC